MKIGLSLSYCVVDIINGLVDIDDVLFIVCGTKFSNDREFSEVMDQYAEFYWSHLPQLARYVATQLKIQGKLIQPRLEGCQVPPIVNGHWYIAEN